ncbi:MAG: LysM peptidoglycan-binding domain-containing protein [Ilumatobacter sp.]|jgi:hypothetical protein|uniref:LysM peptidoglycan-binding domain-containing protein n=1 Tax=Ilumatobacter sp. TaxID=1967498 RepID=UPI0039191D0B
MTTTARTLITAPGSVAHAAGASMRAASCQSARSTWSPLEPSIGVYRRSAASASPCDRRDGSRRAREARRCAPSVRSGSPERRPNYFVRRVGALLLLALAAVIIVMSANSLLASLGAEPASAAEASPAFISAEEAPVSHVARAGDTLWSIAHAYRGDIEHDTYVRALIRLNGGASVQAGQSVLLP